MKFAREAVVLVIALAMFASTVGCGGTTGSTSQDKQVVEGAPLQEQKRQKYLNPLLTVKGWPFDDGKSQYRLTWAGGNTQLPLFAEPDPNSPLLGQLSYEDGDEIETSGDYVAVYVPSTFRTRRTLTIAGSVHKPDSASHGSKFRKTLRKGATVSVFMYAGDGRCYVGIGGRIIVADCPDDKDFVGTFDGPTEPIQMQPLGKLWWVYVNTPAADGWIPLDDRVIADVWPIDAAAPTNTAVAAAPADAEVKPPTVVPTDEATQAREDELFGGSDTGQEPPPDDATASREDEMFGDDSASLAADERGGGGGLGSPLLSDEEIDDRLDAKADAMAVGGFALLQLQYSVAEEGCPCDFPFAAPTFLDVYLDARPHDRVRAYARGRLATDFARSEDETDALGDPIDSTSVDLDQLWIKLDMWRVVYATLGKQRVKWGSGKFWNPTDFLNDTALNPVVANVFDSRLGVTLAKLHLPIEKLGWNFYAIANVDGASAARDTGLAARAEFLYQLTEVALSGSLRRDQPKRVGLDISTGVWLFDFHVEGAALFDDPRVYFEGELDIPAVVPREVSRQDEVLPQVVGGLELQVPYRRGDLMVVGAEAFYNSAGYEDAELYPWMFFTNTYQPFYTGQIYGAAYIGLLGPGNWDDTDIIATTLSNVSDRSFLSRLEVSQQLWKAMRWTTFGNVQYGDTGEFNYGFEIEPNIFTPDGVSVARPLFTVGAALQLEM